MPFGKDDVLIALRSIRDSSTDRDLVELGGVKKISVCDGFIKVAVAAPPGEQLRGQLRQAVDANIRHAAAEAGEAVHEVFVEFVAADAPGLGPQATAAHDPDVSMKQASSSRTVRQGEAHPGSGGARGGSVNLPGSPRIIAIGAGKGGVGKSTISVNLAVGLARQGRAVGLLDGDIYGPSTPTLLGLENEEVLLRDNMIQVFEVHGIKSMTIGKLVEPEKPLIWRGPMAHGAFKQLVEQTQWGELDDLIIDLPPGTGDVPLTMAQLLSLTGAVVVCTPQKVAQDDAVRAVRMFQQLNIEVLGIVENMSYFIGDDRKEYDIFGRGGAEVMAQRMGLPFLGAIPINMKLREFSDAGTPISNFADAGPALRQALEAMVQRVDEQATMAAMRAGPAPQLRVS